jgi:type II secretory pathway pseudopilin PulG
MSLLEVTIVVTIIGVLVAVGVPIMLKRVERSKASEAFKYLEAVRAAQERHRSSEGRYADALTDLDVEQSPPKYFAVGAPAAGATGSLESSWTLTLRRQGIATGFGPYTVTFTQEGYDKRNSIIEGLPDINPSGT